MIITQKDLYDASASTYLPVNTNIQEEKCCEWNNCVHNEVEVGQIVTNVDLIHSQASGLKRGGSQHVILNVILNVVLNAEINRTWLEVIH